MDSEHRFCQALESEINQLSPAFLCHPRLRKRLFDSLCTLAFCMEGPRAVIDVAVKTNQEKKDYPLEEQVEIVENEQLEPVATNILTPILADGSGPEHESWKDERGKELHRVWEVDVLVSGLPLRSIQFLTLYTSILSKHTAISSGYGGNVPQDMIAETPTGKTIGLTKWTDGTRIARLVCFDRKLDFRSGKGWIDIVTSKGKEWSTVRTNVRSAEWTGVVPTDDKGSKFDLIMTTINGHHHIAFRSPNLDIGNKRLQLMSMKKEVQCHTISTEEKMEYDIHSYVQEPVDLTYRLSGYVKDSKKSGAWGHADQDSDGDDDDGGGGGGGGRDGHGPPTKRRKTKKTSYGKGGLLSRKLASATGDA